MRFTDPELGAWYASTELTTAVLEVANGLRKELSLSGLASKRETYREYHANMDGEFVDIFSTHPEFHYPGDSTYPKPQKFGAHVKANGSKHGVIGIRYQSVRRSDHENWVCFVPPTILDVTAARYFDIDVRPTGKVIYSLHRIDLRKRRIDLPSNSDSPILYLSISVTAHPFTQLLHIP